MNLHDVGGGELERLVQYLQQRYGANYEWGMINDSIRYRSTYHDTYGDWNVLLPQDQASYALDATNWRPNTNV